MSNAMKPKTVGRTDGYNVEHAPIDATGLLAHSIILTLAGEKPVGDVVSGDRVITRDSGSAVVHNVRRRKITCDRVIIQAGSLGDKRPDCDTVLPAGQPVLIRDWRAEAMFGSRQALVAAERLIDGEFIRRDASTEMTVIELEFDRAHILYVDGLEVACHTVKTAQTAQATAA